MSDIRKGELVPLHHQIGDVLSKMDPRDAFTVTGLGCLSAGAWMLLPAVGLIVLGLGCAYLGLWHGALIHRLTRED